MKSLKQLLDQVNGEIGFDIPTSYIGSTDPNIIQLVAIAQRVATQMRDLRLQYMTRNAKISMANGTATSDSRIFSYPLPTDFYAFTPDTIYQQGRVDPVNMPTTAPYWAYLTSRAGPQSMQVQARIEQDRLFVFSPDATQSLTFEYVSKYPISNQQFPTLGTPSIGVAPIFYETFPNDDAFWLLDDVLFEMELKWRYKKEKGLDWQQDRQDSQQNINELRASDGSSQTISWPGTIQWPGEPYANLWVA